MSLPPLLLAISLVAGPALAEDEQPAELTTFEGHAITLEDFQWMNRPVIVFADSANDPRFQTQIELLEEGSAGLIERDVVLVTDTDPGKFSDVRKKLRPRGFMLVLIGKDGGVKLRKPFPWDVRELTRVIDKTELRQREVRERREALE